VGEPFGNIFLEELRAPEYSRDLAAKIRAIRNDDLTYSGKKIRAILSRTMDYADVPPVSTLNKPRKMHSILRVLSGSCSETEVSEQAY
jgi:hypothetical protein